MFFCVSPSHFFRVGNGSVFRLRWGEMRDCGIRRKNIKPASFSNCLVVGVIRKGIAGFFAFFSLVNPAID